MGSKRRIAKHIIPIMLKDRKEDQYFVDIFCGGCNIIDKVGGNRIANDNNPYLIGLLHEVAKGGISLPEVDKETYYKVKADKDAYPDWFVGHVGFNCSSMANGSRALFLMDGLVRLVYGIIKPSILTTCSLKPNLSVVFSFSLGTTGNYPSSLLYYLL